LFALAIWGALEASPLNARASLVRGFFAEATFKDWIGLTLILIGLPILIWRNIVVGMWPTLTGRKWFSIMLSSVSILFVLSLPGLAGWLARLPEAKEKLIAATPWLLGAAVIVKLCAAIWIGATIQRRSLLAVREIGLACGVWILAVAVFTAIGAALVDWTWFIPAAAVLLAPLVRIGLAPLALDWNRHR